ncbi:MAG: ATP-binding domain-containing protein, partial [Saprospiraceae bacterium]|nr:ATP-binding domain-containing protein [Saprospiraceae bacterium]
RSAIDHFVAMIQDCGEKAKANDAHVVAEYLARRSGLMDELKQDTTVEGIQRLDNITSLLDGIKTFVEDDTVQTVDGGRLTVDEETADGGRETADGGPVDNFDKSLSGYLQNIALMTDQDDANKEGDYVTLMSVHSAKGLEFKSVFITGLEEQLFPSFMSFDTPEGLDEERRLFYVAITRAEQFLTLSYAASRYRFGQERSNPPSRFLDEINMAHLDASSPIGSRSAAPAGKYERAVAHAAPTAGSSPSKSGVSGSFKPRGPQQEVALRIDPASFKPSPSEHIQAGHKVLHLKFGEGKVVAVDGSGDKRMATIFFPDLDVDKQKRIMLKFAKLQIVG